MAEGTCEYQVFVSVGIGQGNMEYGVIVAAGLLGQERRLWVKVGAAWALVVRAYIKIAGAWQPAVVWQKVAGDWIAH